MDVQVTGIAQDASGVTITVQVQRKPPTGTASITLGPVRTKPGK